MAQKGVAVDGHLYIDKAISLGANTIVCETIPEAKKDGVTYVQVEDTNIALAIIEANFYDKPSRKIP